MGVIPYKTNNSWRKRQVHPPLSWEGLLAYEGESSELHVQVPIKQVMNMVIEAHLASYVSHVESGKVGHTVETIMLERRRQKKHNQMQFQV